MGPLNLLNRTNGAGGAGGLGGAFGSWGSWGVMKFDTLLDWILECVGNQSIVWDPGI